MRHKKNCLRHIVHLHTVGLFLLTITRERERERRSSRGIFEVFGQEEVEGSEKKGREEGRKEKRKGSFFFFISPPHEIWGKREFRGAAVNC